MTGAFALILLTLINLLNYIDRYIVAAVMPAMSAELNLSNSQIGLTMSAFMFGYFLTSPFFGYLADRYRRTYIISVGTFFWSLLTGLSGFAKNFTGVLGTRIAIGVGEAATVSTSQSLLADYFPPQKRNQTMAVFSAAIPVGAALGFIIGGLLAHHWGWRQAFFIAGVPGVLISLLVLFLKEPKRESLENSLKIGDCIQSLIKNKAYLQTVLGYTAFSFTVGGLGVWIPQYLVRVRGISLTEADTLFGLITVISGTLGTLFGGWMAARFLKSKPRGDMQFIYYLALISIPLVFVCFYIQNKYMFYIFLALAEFLLFGTQPTVAVVIVESVTPSIRSFALAMSVFIIHLLGDLISPPIVGLIADHTNLQTGILILPLSLLPCAYFYNAGYKTLSS